MRPAIVEVDEVVQEALRRCRLMAESSNIQIIVDPPTLVGWWLRVTRACW